jgi:hypothetical protein
MHNRLLVQFRSCLIGPTVICNCTFLFFSQVLSVDVPYVETPYITCAKSHVCFPLLS